MNNYTIIAGVIIFIGIFTSPWLIPLGVLVAIGGLIGD